MKRTSRTMHRFFCTNCGREGLPLLARQVTNTKKDILKISIVLGVRVNIITGSATMMKKWQNLKNFIEWT